MPGNQTTRGRRRRRCLLPSGNWRGKNNALSGYDGTDQPQTSGERTPAAKNCPTVSSPLPLSPLEIYCNALSCRPPCRRVEMSMYEIKPVTAGSTGRGDSSARAVIVTALVTGRDTELRLFILEIKSTRFRPSSSTYPSSNNNHNLGGAHISAQKLGLFKCLTCTACV